MTVLFSLVLPISAFAASKSKVSKSRAHGSKLSTDIRFSGSDILGKYQVPGEAIATVEKEKPLLGLIEPRREFKDRIKGAVTQR